VDARGLTIAHAQVSLPFVHDPRTADGSGFYVSLSGLTYDGTTLSLASGDASIGLPEIDLKGFTVAQAQATMHLSISNNHITYDIKGTAGLLLPGIRRGLICQIEIGSIDATHPSNLRSASITVALPVSIPLGEPPVFLLRSITGQLDIGGANGNATYTFSGQLEVSSVDNGFLLDGAVGASVASDGNVGLNGDVKLLGDLLEAHGGFCVRFAIGQGDTVCSDTLAAHSPDVAGAQGWGAQVDRSNGAGFFAAARLRVVQPLPPGCDSANGKCITFDTQAYLHVWKPTATATATSGPTATSTATPTTAPTATGTAHPTATGTPVPVPVPTVISATPPPYAGAAHDRTTPPPLMIAGEGSINATIPQGVFGSFLFAVPEPPCTSSLQAAASVGTFHFYNGAQSTYPSGLKASFHVDVCQGLWAFDKNIFIGTKGVDWDDSTTTHYTLLQDSDAPLPPLSATPNQATVGLRPLDPTALLGLSRMAGALSGQATRAARRGAARLPRLPRGTVRAPGTVTAPLQVAPGQINLLVGLTWHAGAPSLTLIAPDGTAVTPASPGLHNSAFSPPAGQVLPGGATGAVVLLLPHPAPGMWRVRVGHLRGGESYGVQVQAEQSPVSALPVLRVARPAAGQQLVGTPNAPRVTLDGTLSGAPEGSAVALYYTTGSTLSLDGRALPDTAGTLIADPVPVRHGAWRYAWDTGGLPAGTYAVYAVLANGRGPQVVGYAAGTVRVTQPLHPAGPRAVVALQRAGSLTMLWTPPVRAALVAGYRLH